MITFEYCGKIYTPSNLEKKLKKLGTTLDQVKILKDTKDDIQEKQESEILTYHEANDIELEIWQDAKGNVSISMPNNPYIKKDMKLIGTTRNSETKKIEKIGVAEKRLGITYNHH